MNLYDREGIESVGLDEAASRLGLYLDLRSLFSFLFFFSLLIYLSLSFISVIICLLRAFSGVERRRIYDIVNVLESVGV